MINIYYSPPGSEIGSPNENASYSRSFVGFCHNYWGNPVSEDFSEASDTSYSFLFEYECSISFSTSS